MIIDPDSNSAPTAADQIERYPDLRAGGLDLASELEQFRRRENVLVLGIALGGIPTAHEVAKHLEAPLDVVIIRRLLTPQGPGSQVCAASVAGHLVLPEELLPLPEKPSSPLEYFVADALAELQRRAEVCRGRREPLDLANKTVLLVDCGAKTGMTMQAALEALKAQRPARIIAALPLASSGGREAIATLADELICLASPNPFGHVGMWYKDFTRPGDEHVGELLD